MSNRSTDVFDDVHFSSSRYFFADGEWFYYIRTYDNDVKTIGGFPTKELAAEHCNDRFNDNLDYTFYK